MSAAPIPVDPGCMGAGGVRRVVGCMTGTSLDGLDVALVEIEGSGLAMRPRFVRGLSRPLTGVAEGLRELAEQKPMTAGEVSRLMLEFANLHAGAIEQLLAGERCDLVCVHGQTVWHSPPTSWQLMQAAPIARRLGVPVVHDLRQADLAAGGQGAPLTPIADWVWFAVRDDEQPATGTGRDPSRDQAHEGATIVVNLGGFCNATILRAGVLASGWPDVRGFDVCPCNQLLDGIARRVMHRAFDEDGAEAMRGAVHERALEDLLGVLIAIARPGRSLGTGDEALEWISRWRAHVEPRDLAATACDGIAERLTDATREASGGLVLLAGGGARNRRLVRAIESCMGGRVRETDQLGLPGAFREAAHFAVLGALSQDGVAITPVRGADGIAMPGPVAGAWVFSPQREANVDRKAPDLSREARTKTPHPSPLPHPHEREREESIPDRAHVLTEQRHSRSTRLHELSARECVTLMGEIDREVHEAMDAARDAIAALIEAIEPGFLRGGRVVYLGAGTSGRLGVLDASEMPPTFQIDPSRFVGIIAGGDASLRRSSEGREDEPSGAVPELAALRLTDDDAVIGIAAGGTTPYVLGALAWAGKRARDGQSGEGRPVTALLSCASLRERPELIDHVVEILTGPEMVTGSTRLKAGTATKLALNTISTTLMVRAGRVHENLMVDLRASNAKLRDRAARIVATLTGLSREASFEALDRADGLVKVAVVMARVGCAKDEAERRLARAAGRLGVVLRAED